MNFNNNLCFESNDNLEEEADEFDEHALYRKKNNREFVDFVSHKLVENNCNDHNYQSLCVDNIGMNELIEIKQATICMIDICGFSKWCVNRMPLQIVNTMKKYNEFINNNVEMFCELTKIELVGDCCMVVGGMVQTMDRQQCTVAMVKFASNILSNLETIRTLRENEYKGVGVVSSYTFHIIRHEYLWFDSTMCSIKNALLEFDHIDNVYIINNLDKLFETMYSFFWDVVIIHCYSKDTLSKIVEKLIAFREWEQDRIPQNIILVTKITDNPFLEMFNVVKTFKDLKKVINDLRFDSETTHRNDKYTA